MTLSFSTKWPKHMGAKAGKPNYFIQKIWECLTEKGIEPISEFQKYKMLYNNTFKKDWDVHFILGHPMVIKKPHTIRQGNRWRAGMKIHPVINNRTKDRFQFAPVLKCVSTQDIEIIDVSDKFNHQSDNTVYGLKIHVEPLNEFFEIAYKIKVDGKFLNRDQMQILAMIDGFDSLYDFFCYFNTDFKGQIIHWTDLRY